MTSGCVRHVRESNYVHEPRSIRSHRLYVVNRSVDHDHDFKTTNDCVGSGSYVSKVPNANDKVFMLVHYAGTLPERTSFSDLSYNLQASVFYSKETKTFVFM